MLGTQHCPCEAPEQAALPWQPELGTSWHGFVPEEPASEPTLRS